MRSWSDSFSWDKGIHFSRSFFEREGAGFKDVCRGYKAEAEKDRRLSLVGTGDEGAARRLELLECCLVGWWDDPSVPFLKLDFLRKWALHWFLKGSLSIAVLGGGLLILEFESRLEAERVLGRGKGRFKENLLFLEKWSSNLGCFNKGDNAKEAWVRVVGLSLHVES